MKIKELEVIDWFCNGEVGLSSKFIVKHIVTGCISYPFYPIDPGDLNRCIKCLDAIPTIKAVFKEKMKGVSKEWDCLIDNWDDLVEMFIDEAGYDWEKNHRAPKTNAKMSEIIEEAR